MKITFQCGCGKVLKAPPGTEGERTRCPRCNATMTIPGAKVTVAAGDAASGEMWRVKELRTLSSDEDRSDYRFTTLAIAPSGKFALTGSRFPGYHGRALRLWNLPESVEVEDFDDEAETLLGGLKNIQAVAFSSDGRRAACVASSMGEKHVHVFSVGESLSPLPFETDEVAAEGEIHALCFSRDGRFLAAGGKEGICVWGARSGKLYRRFETPVKSVLFSPDDKYVFGGELGEEDSEFNDVLAFSMETGKIARRYRGHTDWVNCLAFSPDGKHVLSGAGGDPTLNSNDYSVRLWDFSDRSMLRFYDGYVGRVGAVSFTADGKLFIAAGLEFRDRFYKNASELIDGRPPCEQWVFAHVRRVSDGKVLGKYEAKIHSRVAAPGDPRQCAFAATPGGRLILIAGEKAELQVFKTAK